MLGLYTPVLLLQAFCVYHAYRNNAEQRWYWLIIFFPLVGCIIYLVDNFYNRKNIQTIAKGVQEVINTNYRLEQLEKAMRFNNSLANKTNLADAYVQYARYPEAIELYTDCLAGFMSDDPTLRIKLLQTHFLNRDYDSTIAVGETLASEKSFEKAEEKVSYAWALHYTGRTDRAGEVFDAMDKSFTNYHQRLEYCKFLQQTSKPEVLKEKLSELFGEIEHMQRSERRLKRDVIREIKDLYETNVGG